MTHYEQGWKTLARNDDRKARQEKAMREDAAAGRRQLRDRRSI